MMNSGDANESLDLLRLPKLRATGSYDEGEALIIRAQSREATIPRCCLLDSLVKNGSKTIRFRDHAIQGRPVWLEIARQRYRCKECGATIYEEIADLDSERRVTTRFRDHLFREGIKHSFSVAAGINGVHETLIRRVFEEESDKALASYTPAMPYVLGMDELYLHGRARFILGDVQGRRMLDMQPSRRETDLRAYFDGFLNRERVEVVTQDMWSGYAKITRQMFPNARTVIDKYHVVRTANYGVEFVRKAHYQALTNADRVKLKRQKPLFLTRWDSCKPEPRKRLERLFSEYPKLREAYFLKEGFYDIYYRLDRSAADRQMKLWVDGMPGDMQRAFKPSLDAIKNWRPHILRYFDYPFTNAYIEGLNSLIRRMNAAGAGYTFDVLRKKALLKHGKVGEVQVFDPPDPSSDLPWDGIQRFMRIDGGKNCYFREVGLGASLSTLETDIEAGTF